jgi:tetratricopeptide (TPR) repeat protein
LQIPDALVTNVREGKAVLVLGAGASIGAVGPAGAKPPSGRELAGLLSDKFLGGKFRTEPLGVVSEYAISETSLTTVQDYIRSIFLPFEPAVFHRLIPRFRWHGLATTNYDQVVEKAYDSEPQRLQRLQPVIQNGDSLQDLIRDPNSVPFLKLHGCISRIASAECPLILTIDQYVSHRQGRSRLFLQLEEWGYERPLVFAGQSVQDPDLRGILLQLASLGEARSRFYTVTPDADDITTRFWETKRISSLKGTFKEFLEELDRRIPAHVRPLAALLPDTAGFQIQLRFARPDFVLSDACRRFLSDGVDYVRGLTAFASADARAFYRGEDPGWAAMDQNLDVRRKVLDTILADVVLIDESSRPKSLECILIKGHAGAGKSVLLRRLAWDATRDYDALCLFLRAHAELDVASVQELLDAVNERVYLFVDDAAEHVRDVATLVKRVTASGQRLTIVLGERVNEWNVYGAGLESSITDEYLVEYLEGSEIEALLGLLERHRALGTLQNASKAERVAAFGERAGRQLLVALHEATLGKPFEEIIEDEYHHIVPIAARDLYLTICVLNRLNVPVRAGLVSRIHGIPFELFKEQFFRPLEHVVHTSEDRAIRDHVYAARHPYIADMVFRRVLVHADDRLVKYLRALEGLNLEYNTDLRAFRQMVRGKVVDELFPDRGMADRVFRAARDLAGDDAFVLQQMALYEMNRQGPDLTQATALLTKAASAAPHDMAIKHSQAELNLRLADDARTPLERDQRLREAGRIARALRTERARSDGAHAFTTLVKIAVKRLELLLEEGEGGGVSPDLTSAIREAEEALEEGLQRYPNDSFLLDAESKLAQLLKDSERALLAMKSAFHANPKSGYIAARLARILDSKGDKAGARETIERALEASPTDRRLHFFLAKLLMRQAGDEHLIEYHLQRSFISGDSNHEAQLLYGRQLYILGRHEDAKKVFQQLQRARVPFDVRMAPAYPLQSSMSGRVRRAEATYWLVEREGLGDWVLAHKRNIASATAQKMGIGARVSFKIAFNFAGAIATDVRLIAS